MRWAIGPPRHNQHWAPVSISIRQAPAWARTSSKVRDLIAELILFTGMTDAAAWRNAAGDVV